MANKNDPAFAGHDAIARRKKPSVCTYLIDKSSEVLDWWDENHFDGLRTEHVWCNYPTPDVLHDSRYVGNDKREREKIRRRTRRLVRNLNALPKLHRQAVLDEVAASCS